MYNRLNKIILSLEMNYSDALIQFLKDKHFPMPTL